MVNDIRLKKVTLFFISLLYCIFILFLTAFPTTGQTQEKEVLEYYTEEPVNLDSESRTKGLSELLKQFGFSVYHQTQTRFLPETDIIWPMLLEDLKNASESIFLEFYELDEGEVLDSILDILFEKVKENIDVRIIYDAIGSRSFSNKTHRVIEDHGILIQAFHPIRFSGLSEVAFRDHRKIAVIDGKVAYTGGFNLADQYFNVIHPYGHWKDTGVRVNGDAVESFMKMFLSLWEEITTNAEGSEISECSESADTGLTDGSVQPYTDLPNDHDDINRSILIYLLQNAKDRLYLSSPYLMLEAELLDEFEKAAERGIDIRIITPRIPDKAAIYAVTKSYYPALMKIGVQIYEYVPGFNHSKVWLMDDDIACVGSVNLDLLSFYQNQEVSMILYGVENVLDVVQDFELLFSICEPMNTLN